MIPTLLTQRRLMDKPKAARHGGAARVARITTDLHALRLQGLEGEGAEDAHSLRHVALALCGGSQPVADFERGHIPVYPMQPASAQKSPRLALPYAERQIFSQNPFRQGAAHKRLGIVRAGMRISPRS